MNEVLLNKIYHFLHSLISLFFCNSQSYSSHPKHAISARYLFRIQISFLNNLTWMVSKRRMYLFVEAAKRLGLEGDHASDETGLKSKESVNQHKWKVIKIKNSSYLSRWYWAAGLWGDVTAESKSLQH